MIPYPRVPEAYTLLGVVFFLACSFFTHFFNVSELFGRFLSTALTLLYQIVALAGLGQMFILNFVYPINIELRAILGFLFLVAAVLNMVVFIVFMVKRSEYLSHYFRFTFDSGPSVFLQLMDAASGVKVSLMALFHRHDGK